MKPRASIRVRLLAAAATLPCLAGGAASASHTSTLPQEVGKLSPLIPVPKDAIHAGLAWTPQAGPKICFAMRPSEYVGHHLVDPGGHLKEAFERFVYGGFGFSEGAHGLDESVTKGDIDRDNFVCWNLTHPKAFNDTGEFAIVGPNGEDLVTKADFALNAAAFTDAGHSRGLEYNIFCAGNVALADGRWLFIGGHDKSGNNGIRKLNIFDPATETWAPRPRPRVKKGFLVDPEGAFPARHADPLNEANTDPPHSSDMRYQRWYPTGVVLPNKDVLILSGSDQDTSLGPPGTQFFPACTSTTESAACSKVRQAVPEVYSPKTDRTVALENARKLFNMYPRSYVVQTGRGERDWRVAVIGEVDRDHLPGLRTIGQYDPFAYTGATYFLNVLGALRDPDRNTQAEDHWRFVDEAVIAHDSGASAQLWELDREGHAVAQRVALFGGNCGSVPEGTTCNSATVEMIDFQAKAPQWKVQQPLIQPANQNNAVVLPDGRVVIIGGAVGRGPWVNSFHLQLFDPAAGTVTPLVETQVARHDHATVALLSDGSVAILGGNATDLAGDVAHLDLGIPVAQIYKPPYLFKGPRPVIQSAPKKISYGHKFRVNVANKGEIGSVALIRLGPVTHNWDWGNRYVKLWFERQGGGLLVRAPAVPGLAVPGYYMLFIVDDAGVPSLAKLVHLD